MGDILDEWALDDTTFSDSHVFHRTDKASARQILKEGFDPQKGDKPEEVDEEFLEQVAELEGVSYPVDRRNSSFFYPSYDYVKGSFGSRLGSCLVVVDISKIVGPMWLADMDKYDSVIGWTPLDNNRARDGPYDEEEIDVVLDYLSTLTQISRGSELRARMRGMAVPELMIEGTIPTSAIEGVVE